jgi:hypothetical protein
VSSDILSQIDTQLGKLLSTRAVFPYMKENLVGETSCRTASLYRHYGFDISFTFAEPLTAEKIGEINEIGHWINQNYVVRLCALLESCHVVPKNRRINKELAGHEEVEILRTLRNVFAHTAGWYRDTDARERRLRERIIQHFSLKPENHPASGRMFPIPIDEVLIPLTEGCKRYVEASRNCASGGA